MVFEGANFEKEVFSNLALGPELAANKEFLACEFKGCNFSAAFFSGTIFINCHFINCNFSNTKLTNCSFQGVIFENCKILGVLFSEINTLLLDWCFSKCKISLCNFNNIDILGLLRLGHHP